MMAQALLLIVSYFVGGIVATIILARRCTYTGARWFYPIAIALCIVFWPIFILDGIKD